MIYLCIYIYIIYICIYVHIYAHKCTHANVYKLSHGKTDKRNWENKINKIQIFSMIKNIKEMKILCIWCPHGLANTYNYFLITQKQYSRVLSFMSFNFHSKGKNRLFFLQSSFKPGFFTSQGHICPLTDTCSHFSEMEMSSRNFCESIGSTMLACLPEVLMFQSVPTVGGRSHYYSFYSKYWLTTDNNSGYKL
jgi:hypothetical protein